MIHHSKDLHYDPYRRICQYRLKHKIATIHRFFQTYLILTPTCLKKFVNDFFCIRTNHDPYVVTLLLKHHAFCNVD